MKRLLLAAAALAALSALVASVALADPGRHDNGHPPQSYQISFGGTKTPIKHVVEIFQENVSFDHYFGTYPHAANSDGQPSKRCQGTPAVDGLPPATELLAAAEPAPQHEPADRQPERGSRRSGSTATPPACPATPAASSPATRTTTTATSRSPSTAA